MIGVRVRTDKIMTMPNSLPPCKSIIIIGLLLGQNPNDRGRAASAGIRGSKFRHGLLTLMIHSIDPMHDGGKLMTIISLVQVL